MLRVIEFESSIRNTRTSIKSSTSPGIDKQEDEYPSFNLYIGFGEEISEIYMRKPRRKRTGRVRGPSNKKQECLRYPTQARRIRLEYLI